MLNDAFEESNKSPVVHTEVIGLVGTKEVPNVIPKDINVGYRLAIVGEAPGEDEERYGIPFVGASGYKLDEVCKQVGIIRSQCFVGNVCRYRPPGNKIDKWLNYKGFTHPHVTNGAADLRQQLIDWKPNCILALGKTAMWALSSDLNVNGITLERRGFGHPHVNTSISDYVGFVTPSNLSVDGRVVKLVSTYHPAFILRSYKDEVFLRFGASRALEEARTTETRYPDRAFNLRPTASEIVSRLDHWPTGLYASLDIEGGLDGWLCISIIDSPFSGFCIAFSNYTDAELMQIYPALSRFLYRDDVPKVLQNSLYEGFVLHYGFNMLIRNIREDTMLKWWEIYPELPKALDVQAAICTKEPQWKFLIAYTKKDRAWRVKQPGFNGIQAALDKWRACCIDSAVTLEACRVQDSMLNDGNKIHYEFNKGLLSALRYMEVKGINYDQERARMELERTRAQLVDCGERLTLRAGWDLRGNKGSISTQKLAKCLYEQKKYPEQKKGRGEDAKITTDVEALLTLQYRFSKDPFLADVLLHRKLESIRETLEVRADPDGRVRCGYNIVGTETGRLSCYTSPTGSGANLQTITKKLRCLYCADPGYFMFQCDLSGADGWTVAARCLSLGDSTMWNDYKAGLKPAKILAMMFHHGVTSTMCSLEELKRRCDEESVPGGCCDKDGWLYFACKRCQHATNYLVQPKTMATQIMQDSYKVSGTPIYIDINTAASLQRYYMMRYPGVRSYHVWGERITFDGKNITDMMGHERRFLGRRRSKNYKTQKWEADSDTWREVLAHEPQANTTGATNKALEMLLDDEENRWPETTGRIPYRFIIQPLHQVHDALIGQFPIELTNWAVKKIPTYFSTEFEIAGVKVTIPFEGEYGPNWGELGTKYGGGIIHA